MEASHPGACYPSILDKGCIVRRWEKITLGRKVLLRASHQLTSVGGSEGKKGIYTYLTRTKRSAGYFLH